MFDNLLNQGSLISIVLMAYAGTIGFEVAMHWSRDRYGLNRIPITDNPLSILLVILMMPCALWPAVYIGLLDGWVAGLVSFFGLQVIGALVTPLLAIRQFLGFHFIPAAILFPVGYYLSITSLI